MKYCYQLLLCMALCVCAHTDMYAQKENEVYHAMISSNGQTYLLAEHSRDAVLYVDIYFRIGPVYEVDTASGTSLILSHILDARIASALSGQAPQVQYYSTLEPDQIGFHFMTDPAGLGTVLSLTNDKVINPVFDSNAVVSARAMISREIDSLNGLSQYRTDARITKQLWGNDFKKINLYGDENHYNTITAEQVTIFHRKYFLPFNNTISITGDFNEAAVLEKLQSTFADFKSKEFNPELITRVIEFKPMVNAVQFTDTSSNLNKATITYQNPGARQDREASYCAFILAQLINDKDGRIQKRLDSAGLKNVNAVYTCNNFYGVFTISAEPASGHFYDAFAALSTLMKDITGKNYFDKSEMQKASRDISMALAAFKANHREDYLVQVCRYRFEGDEAYYSSLGDSISTVKLADMRNYANDYYIDYSGVKCLYTSKSAIDSAAPAEQYFSLSESIEDIKFSYELNKTDIESDSAKVALRKLIQWLRFNPDNHVQINGFSDKGEFMKSYDTTVLKFIDSTASFRKAMPDAIKKKYLRIEMMRAMKIAKTLYEAGISEDRISGTSMVLTSEDKDQAAANRKCTITIEKIRPRISLYEYHFGKKKPEGSN